MTDEKRCRCGRLARCCDEWECLLREFDEAVQHMLDDVEVEGITEVTYTSGSVVDFAVDLTNRLLWVRSTGDNEVELEIPLSERGFGTSYDGGKS